MSVSCSRCGQTWPRDPALEVECPTCGAAVGRRCKRPSEHALMPANGSGSRVHNERDRLAMERGLLVKCPGEKPVHA